MTKATLLNPHRFHRAGRTWERGISQDISEEVARSLRNDPRFSVEDSADSGVVQVAETSAVDSTTQVVSAGEPQSVEPPAPVVTEVTVTQATPVIPEGVVQEPAKPTPGVRIKRAVKADAKDDSTQDPSTAGALEV